METNERDLLITNKIIHYCNEIEQTHKSFHPIKKFPILAEII